MAMQEFLATYAVKVDEDGARRLQRILEENRTSGAALAAVFESARSSLEALKKELSDASGLKNVFSSLNASSVKAGSSGSSSGSSSSSSGSSGGGSALSGLSDSVKLSVSADLSGAEDSLADFISRLEAERPRLQADATGINSAVSTAVAQIRSQLSSLKITVPVTAVASVDTSNVKASVSLSGSSGSAGSSGSSGFSGSSGSSGSGSSGSSSSSSSGSSGSSASRSASSSSGSGSRAVPITSKVATFGSGGRVDRPTLAMIAEEGKTEYVIPTDDGQQAASLLRGFFADLSANTRDTVLSGLISGQKLGSSPSATGPSALSFPDSDQSVSSLSGSGLRSPSPSGSNLSFSSRSDPGQAFASRSVSGLPSPSLSGSGLSSLIPPESTLSTHTVLSLQSLRESMDSVFSSLASLVSPDQAAPSFQSVQAPVNIYVSGSASPETTGSAIYDTARRALLKTLKGVFD